MLFVSNPSFFINAKVKIWIFLKCPYFIIEFRGDISHMPFSKNFICFFIIYIYIFKIKGNIKKYNFPF